MSDFVDSGARVEGAGGLRIFFSVAASKRNTSRVCCHRPGFQCPQWLLRVGAPEQFAAAGLAVYAVDLRGRGNSDGERFYVENFEDYVSDVEAVGSKIRREVL